VEPETIVEKNRIEQIEQNNEEGTRRELTHKRGIYRTRIISPSPSPVPGPGGASNKNFPGRIVTRGTRVSVR
jgi:hypothetical protein